MCHCIDAIRGHAGKQQRRAKYFKHDPQGNLARLSSLEPEFPWSMARFLAGLRMDSRGERRAGFTCATS